MTVATRGGRVGENARRIDGVPKVLGEYAYGSDLHTEHMLWGVTVRSPCASARIRGVSRGTRRPRARRRMRPHRRRPSGGAHLRTGVRGPARAGGRGRPLRRRGRGGRRRRDARAGAPAAELVAIEYEPLPASPDMEDALGRDAPQVHEFGNVLRHVHIRPRRPRGGRGRRLGRGLLRDRDAGPGGARPRGRPRRPGRRRQRRPLRRDAVAPRRPPADRAVPRPARGEDPASRSPASAARSARARTSTCRSTPACSLCDGSAGEDRLRPRGVLPRPRAPAPVADVDPLRRHAGGPLVTADVRLLLDGGAYASSSPAVLGNAATFAAGPYEVPNVRVEATVVYTNNPPCGAMRGFGAPQVCFAYEAAMDALAAKLGLDPLELRLRNALHTGSVLPTGQVLEAQRRCASARRCRDPRRRRSRRRPRCDRLSRRRRQRRSRRALRRGVGFAVGYKNVAYSEGFDDAAEATVTLPPAPMVRSR